MASEEPMAQPSLGKALMGEFDVKVVRAGACEYVNTPDQKKISMFPGETATQRKAFKMQVKSKKASARMAESPTLRAANGDVVATAAAARAKPVFPGRLGAPIRRPVLNTILRSLCKCATASIHQERPLTFNYIQADMEVVDDVLIDLPRATRSEPTAAVLPKLEDEWM